MTDDLNWAPDHINGSLGIVYREAVERAQHVIDWYFRSKNRVSRMAGVLRLCAILGISIGAVGPLIASVWSLKLLPFSSPLSATVFATIAATFVGVDRAFGVSSRHMRFVSAAFDIQKLLAAFRLNWQSKMSDLRGQPASGEDVRFLLEMARSFEEAVGNVVESETAKGRGEYEKGLAAIRAEAEEMSSKAKGARRGEQ